jgi:hypothetical protein
LLNFGPKKKKGAKAESRTERKRKRMKNTLTYGGSVKAEGKVYFL